MGSLKHIKLVVPICFVLMHHADVAHARSPSVEELSRAAASSELYSFVQKLCRAAANTKLDLAAIRRLLPPMRTQEGSDFIELYYTNRIVTSVRISKQEPSEPRRIVFHLADWPRLLATDLKEHFGTCIVGQALDAISGRSCYFPTPIKVDAHRSCSLNSDATALPDGQNVLLNALVLKIDLSGAPRTPTSKRQRPVETAKPPQPSSTR